MMVRRFKLAFDMDVNVVLVINIRKGEATRGREG